MPVKQLKCSPGRSGRRKEVRVRVRVRFVSRQPPPRRPTTGQLNRGSPVMHAPVTVYPQLSVPILPRMK